ncbi:potassium channel subfamily K member 5b [Brachyhypopomus gauderio]|uniref:potassium channel subfamily K member 5b n=1 Tax=Brachyhypopomus gauderio TaxID=698409 RepID=UPI004041DA07
MADKGPILTSVIIFYISLGAAIFQVLEEPNWKSAVEKYKNEKATILQKHPCLTKEDLDEIIEVVATAAGQGVIITGEENFNIWTWQNAVIFAATIITTIGYGHVAPKTAGGRGFCILFGLCGIPLCLTWISQVGTFFGSRARRLSHVLLHKGLSAKKVQLICTTLFLLWGLLFHLVIPPFIFMTVEKWTYLEGFYFCFITLTTVGFGDYVAGVNKNVEYQPLYRFCVEMWIYMGLAWLSLFFSWNVHMVVEAHKVLKKRRQMHHKHFPYKPALDEPMKKALHHNSSIVDIFQFMSEKGEDYSDVIRAIGMAEKRRKQEEEELTRSKSCSDLLKQLVVPLDHSPRQKRRFSIGDNVYMIISRVRGSSDNVEEQRALLEPSGDTENGMKTCLEKDAEVSWDSKESHLSLLDSMQKPNFTINSDENTEQQQETRFSVVRVDEVDLLEKGQTEERSEHGN